MPTDAMSVAQAALLEARQAVTQVLSLEKEFIRRYQEADAVNERRHRENLSRIDGVDCKLDEVSKLLNIAEGRTDARNGMFSSLPGLFWQTVLQLVSGGVIALMAVWASKTGHM